MNKFYELIGLNKYYLSIPTKSQLSTNICSTRAKIFACNVLHYILSI